MKAVHIFPASVMALAIGVSAIGASAKDDARKETIEIANVQGGPTASQPDATTNYNPKELGVDKIQSPRDPASGQATGIQSPRDPASGQPNSGDNGTLGAGNSFSAGQDTRMDSQIVRDGGAQPGNTSRTTNPNQPNGFNIELAGSGELGAVQAADSGASTTVKKPHRNRQGTRGKRQHKPLGF